jgi:hypothetical protein
MSRAPAKIPIAMAAVITASHVPAAACDFLITFSEICLFARVTLACRGFGLVNLEPELMGPAYKSSPRGS